MATLRVPPLHKQPAGSHKCWAYALASWMAVQKGRKAVEPEEFVRLFKNYLEFGGQGGLPGQHFNKVVTNNLVMMKWRSQDGATLDYEEFKGYINFEMYIYVVARPKKAAADEPGHARVLFGYAADEKIQAFRMIDPITGEGAWKVSEIAEFKLLLGIPKERSFLAWGPGQPTWFDS